MVNDMELEGQRFTRLLVLERSRIDKWNRAIWLCLCDCGTKKEVPACVLINGKTKSCGCLVKDSCVERFTKHGMSPSGDTSPEYEAWSNMKQRCYNPNYKNFKHWGGRGIIVCDRWLNSFENFLEDMGVRPSDEHSLDRKNNDLNYDKSNCRWTTEYFQKRNRSSTVWVEYAGERMVMKDWARKRRLNYNSVHAMYKKRGLEETIRYYNLKYA
jgi:hypothetical protein